MFFPTIFGSFPKWVLELIVLAFAFHQRRNIRLTISRREISWCVFVPSFCSRSHGWKNTKLSDIKQNKEVHLTSIWKRLSCIKKHWKNLSKLWYADIASNISNSPNAKQNPNLKNCPPQNQYSTWKWMVGKLLSFWEGLFSGAMLVCRGVCGQDNQTWRKGQLSFHWTIQKLHH